MKYSVIPILYLLSVTNLFADNVLKVNHAWIQESPPTIRISAAYLEIENSTSEQVELLAITSPGFEQIEIHSTRMENGVVKMRKLDSLSIPANSTFTFSPGNYHIMLFNSENPLKAGDLVPLELVFSNGESLTVNAEVNRNHSDSKHHH